LVDKPDDLRGSWQQALTSDRPVVLEVKTDPNVSALASARDAKSKPGPSLSSIVEGDPSAGHMIADTAQQVLGGILKGNESWRPISRISSS
jgi:pyruvate dehydrogenase (quinone)